MEDASIRPGFAFGFGTDSNATLLSGRVSIVGIEFIDLVFNAKHDVTSYYVVFVLKSDFDPRKRHHTCRYVGREGSWRN